MPRELQSSLTPGSTWAGAVVPGSGRHLHSSSNTCFFLMTVAFTLIKVAETIHV